MFYLALYCITNHPKLGLKQQFIVISRSSICWLASVGQFSLGVSGAAVICRLDVQDGSSHGWYFMLALILQLSWGWRLENLHVASPCGMSLSQCGGWIPRQNAAKKRVFQGAQAETSRLPMIDLDQSHLTISWNTITRTTEFKVILVISAEDWVFILCF